MTDPYDYRGHGVVAHPDDLKCTYLTDVDADECCGASPARLLFKLTQIHPGMVLNPESIGDPEAVPVLDTGQRRVLLDYALCETHITQVKNDLATRASKTDRTLNSWLLESDGA